MMGNPKQCPVQSCIELQSGIPSTESHYGESLHSVFRSIESWLMRQGQYPPFLFAALTEAKKKVQD